MHRLLLLSALSPGVEIPRVFSILNHASVYNVMDEGKWQYKALLDKGTDATVRSMWKL